MKRDGRYAPRRNSRQPRFEFFARQLKAALKERGWTVAEFAQQMGLSRSTVSNWTAALRLPDSVKVAKIAEVLGKPASYFVDEAEEEDLYERLVAVVVDVLRRVAAGEAPAAAVTAETGRHLERRRREQLSPALAESLRRELRRRAGGDWADLEPAAQRELLAALVREVAPE